jgi:antitoxin PrlF
MQKRKRTLLISKRGQITLPLDLRKRYRLDEGGVVIVEEGMGELTLKPAVVMEVDYFSDKDTEGWLDQDRALSE